MVAGDYNFTISIADEGGLTTEDTVILTVNETPEEPPDPPAPAIPGYNVFLIIEIFTITTIGLVVMTKKKQK